MHEFSLATNILEIVQNSLTEAHKQKATKIVLEIGPLSGVEEPALYTALESLQPGTCLETAKIETIHTKGIAYCKNCNKKFEITELFSLCPTCNGFEKEIISGKEFNILSIDAE